MLGASGGTGLAAIELGKIMGARVIACASSDEKLAFARAHGADETVNYASEDLRDALSGSAASTASTWSTIRSAALMRSRRCVRSAWEGRYLVVGFAAGEIPKMPLNLVLLKSCDIRGVFWGAWTKREPQASAHDDRHRAAGAPRANSARMCTRPIRWPRPRPRSKPSPTAR